MNFIDNSKEWLLKAGIAVSDIELTMSKVQQSGQRHFLLHTAIHSCSNCDRRNHCIASPAIGTGPINSDLMIVSDYPTTLETGTGVGHISADAQVLTFLLMKAGIDRDKAYMTYAVKCSASHDGSQEEKDACKQHLLNEVAVVRPKVILTFGEVAAAAVNPSWKNNMALVHLQPVANNNIKFISTHSPEKILLHTGDEQKYYKSAIWETLKLVAALGDFK